MLGTNDIWVKFLSGRGVLGADDIWVKFLSGAGAMLLTFLAGAELDPSIFKLKWKEATTTGLASFILPFLGSAAAAHYFLGWGVMPSWLAGIAMSTTSAAIVYVVTLEFGFNTTEYGKSILLACFVTDLMSVVALGLIFTVFTIKTLISLGVAAVALVVLPWLTPRLFKRYGGQLSEFETKFLLFCLLGMGALADWADSEAVLPAYLIGMVLAGTVGKDHALIRRLRTLTFGLMTPFYFILVGTFVSIPALLAAPAPFIFFLIVKMATKFAGVFPVTKLFDSPNKEAGLKDAWHRLRMTWNFAVGVLIGGASVAASFFWLAAHPSKPPMPAHVIAAPVGSSGPDCQGVGSKPEQRPSSRPRCDSRNRESWDSGGPIPARLRFPGTMQGQRGS